MKEKTINELLKDRWHPYDEEPRNHSNIIYLNADGDIYSKQYVKVEGFRTWRDSDKRKCQPKEQHEFTIKGVKIMAASKKDAIKKFNHRKK